MVYDTQAKVQFQSLRAPKIRVGSQDLRIAAIALSKKATLITGNYQDFEHIEGLTLQDWSSL